MFSRVGVALRHGRGLQSTSTSRGFVSVGNGFQINRLGRTFSTLKKAHPSTYVYKVSPEMVSVIGTDTAKRGEVLKLIWEYAKNNNLKSSEGITCDAKLKSIFDNKASVKRTEVMKFMSKHILERVA
mmetsp:Transcript_5510/g.6969  ORF Transcript_5510/g.6969 Transcript_5510/m.6969 type:complete len:127 (-) Transcript_5510:1772-2152(-)